MHQKILLDTRAFWLFPFMNKYYCGKAPLLIQNDALCIMTKLAIRKGKQQVVRAFIESMSFHKRTISKCALEAAIYGQYDILHMLIDYYLTNIPIILDIEDLPRYISSEDWRDIVRHKDCFKLILENSVMHCRSYSPKLWHYFPYEIVEYLLGAQDLETLEWFILKNPKYHGSNFLTYNLKYQIKQGHYQNACFIIKWTKQMVPQNLFQQSSSFQEWFRIACWNDQLELAQLLYELFGGLSDYHPTWTWYDKLILPLLCAKTWQWTQTL